MSATTDTRRRGRKRGDGEGSIRWSEKKKLWIARLMVGYRADGKPDVREVSAKLRGECQRKLDELRQREHGPVGRCQGWPRDRRRVHADLATFDRRDHGRRQLSPPPRQRGPPHHPVDRPSEAGRPEAGAPGQRVRGPPTAARRAREREEGADLERGPNEGRQARQDALPADGQILLHDDPPSPRHGG